jgi:hypothetical protein
VEGGRWKVGTTRHQAELLGGPELLFELELELAPLQCLPLADEQLCHSV